MLSINYIKPNKDPLMQCDTIVLARTLFLVQSPTLTLARLPPKMSVVFDGGDRFANLNCCKHRATITKYHRLATLGDLQSSARSDK